MVHTARQKHAARGLLIETVKAIANRDALPDIPDDLQSHWIDCTLSSGLGPLIAHKLLDAGTSVPTELKESIRPVAARHLLHLAVLNLVKNTLEAADVRWLVFKGPAVAEQLYEVPSARTYSDVDILIHPADFTRGLAALLAGPARLIDQNWSLIGDRQQGEITLAIGSTVIDLHWHFFSSSHTRSTFQLDIRRTFDHAVRSRLGGIEMTTLDPIDTLIFLATHAVLSGGHRLKWMYDFHCAATQLRSSTTEINRRTQMHHVGLIVSVMAARTAGSLGSELPLDHRLNPWRMLSRLANTVAPPESEFLNAYTARAFLSATRTSAPNSCVQLSRNTLRLARTGADRRGHVVDRTILHQPGGSDADKSRWLDMIASHG